MSNSVLKTAVLSSLHRVFPEACPEDAAVNSFSALKNEPLSFQIAYKDTRKGAHAVNLRIESELPVSLYAVQGVPVLHTDVAGMETEAAVGIYPDLLIPKKVNPELSNDGFWSSDYFEVGEKKLLTALSSAWQSVWITVNENKKSLKAGNYKITFKFLSGATCEEIGREEVSFEIIDQSLVPETFPCTNWFHCDCLCDIHGVEPMSDDFFTAVYNYAHAAALNGQTMLLTPCFTPPLDTPVGKERKTVQLVGVKVVAKDKYEFDFKNLKRYIDVLKKAGIKYFEHNHLFTQWGAKAAPKIVADVKGKEKRIFGWDTPASGAKYRKFLGAYIPAVREFFRNEGIEKKVLFHISDEPIPDHIESFKAALGSVGNLLDGCMVGDALSHFELYKLGLVKTPIVATNFMEDFRGKAPSYWCYYTGEQIGGLMSNRLNVVSPERNRMIGAQMYAYKVKGFLQWGYNFYYDCMSHGITDPCLDPGIFRMSCGTSYLVYPDRGLGCYQSTRQKVFGEGLNDQRALKTLEKLTSRENVEKLLEKHFGKVTFFMGPTSPEQYLEFRKSVNEEIKSASAKKA